MYLVRYSTVFCILPLILCICSSSQENISFKGRTLKDILFSSCQHVFLKPQHVIVKDFLKKETWKSCCQLLTHDIFWWFCRKMNDKWQRDGRLVRRLRWDDPGFVQTVSVLVSPDPRSLCHNGPTCHPQSCLRIWSPSSFGIAVQRSQVTMGAFSIQRSCLPPQSPDWYIQSSPSFTSGGNVRFL